MRRLTSFAVLSLMLVGLALTGCGDGSGSPDGTGPIEPEPTLDMTGPGDTSPGGLPNDRGV